MYINNKCHNIITHKKTNYNIYFSSKYTIQKFLKVTHRQLNIVIGHNNRSQQQAKEYEV